LLSAPVHTALRGDGHGLLAFGFWQIFSGSGMIGFVSFLFQQEWHHPRERKLKQVVTKCWSGPYAVCTCCTISSTV
jgi:hypothetical protein